MRQNINNSNRKIVTTNEKLGIKGIQNQQGTTRIIYDSLPIDSSTQVQTLRFFENVNTRKFPLTNLTENKLQIGESIVLERFSFYILSIDKVTKQVRAVLPIDNIQAGTNAIYRSDMSIDLGQNRVVKSLPLDAMYAPFNKDAKFYGQILINPGVPALTANLGMPNDVFYFDNPIVIPQQLEFVVELKIAPFAATFNDTSDFFLVCKLEGLGSLFAPKVAF
jgi:hypothetical protein